MNYEYTFTINTSASHEHIIASLVHKFDTAISVKCTKNPDGECTIQFITRTHYPESHVRLAATYPEPCVTGVVRTTCTWRQGSVTSPASSVGSC